MRNRKRGRVKVEPYMTADPRKYYVRDRPGQHHNYHLVNRRDRADITSFYFTRFPEDATEEELWFQFKQMGDVREIFIPKLRNKEGRKYGFVRFKGVSDAKRMERKLDNIIVGGLKLHVNIPKYGRGKARQEQYVAKHVRQMEGENGKGRVATPPNVMKRTYAEAVISHTENRGQRRSTTSILASYGSSQSSVTLEIPKGMKKCYKDAWVGRQKRQEIFERLDDELSWILGSKVAPKYLGDDMVLLLGLSDTKVKEMIREEINNGTSMFYSMEKWNSELKSGNRLVWIQCSGIPLVAWSIKYIRKIVAAVGNLVEVDNDVDDMQRLDRARVLVKTPWRPTIQHSVTVQIDGDTHRVHLVEEN